MNIKLLSLLGILFLTSCFNISGNSGKKGNGKVISKEVSISDYSKIEGGGNVNIIYEQNDNKAPYLRYEIDENLSEYVSIKNEDLTLKIKTTESLNTEKFKVYTNSKLLSSVALSGASNININNDLNSTNLTINLSGASDLITNNKITVNELLVKASGASDITISKLETKKLNLSLSGSSDAIFEGIADTLEIEASGASDAKLSKLESKVAQVGASGSSGVYIFVTEELKAKTSGSSDIEYKGAPKLKSVSTSGSSNIEEK